MKSKIILNDHFSVGAVDPRIFGGFVEHLGRCVYEGIYESGHPDADENGFRMDVTRLVKALRPPIIRYPGGNFVSGHNWEDGVGSKERRPVSLDAAWRSLESNEFGTDEFMAWCQVAETLPMMTVNLGTRGPESAANLVEYCNMPGGTKYSDLRKVNGGPNPYKIKHWCLGNELDGPWQIGQKTAEAYGRAACETAKLMKMIDPDIEVTACFSSSPGMGSFPVWGAEALSHAFDFVEYVSLHQFAMKRGDDTPRFLGTAEVMDDYIKATAACCDYVAAKKRSSKRVMISFDEWNVWYHSRKAYADFQKEGTFQSVPPLLEDVYTFEDALLVGCLLNTLINNCDRVKIACLAQLVNVIAPIMTRPRGPAWRQTIYHPLFFASNHGRGICLRQVVESGAYEIPSGKRIPFLCSSSVRQPDGTVVVFAVNRSLDENMDLHVELRDFDQLRSCEWTLLAHRELEAVNTEHLPNNVAPEVVESQLKLKNDTLQVNLPPVSWNMLRVSR